MALMENYKDKEYQYYMKALKIKGVYDKKAEQTHNKEIIEQGVDFWKRFSKEHSAFESGEYDTTTKIDMHFRNLDDLFSSYMRLFNSKYSNGVNAFASTKEDAEVALQETVKSLNKLKAQLKEFNEEFRKTGKHMNNIRAVNTMNEISEKIIALQNKFDSLKNFAKTDFQKLVDEFNHALGYYQKLTASIVNYKPYYLGDKPNFQNPPQPGE